MTKLMTYELVEFGFEKGIWFILWNAPLNLSFDISRINCNYPLNDL
jgi:hypothetical protein